MKKHSTKLLLVFFWLLIIGLFIYYLYSSGTSIIEAPSILQSLLQDFGLLNAALLYIVLYTIRPVLFFPATPFSLLAGTLFGPFYGLFLAVVGGNLSANFAFIITRYLGRNYVKDAETGFIKKVDKGLRNNGVVTTMILRFIYLPFDPVNFGCGLTSMRQRDYAIGTFIGILPGNITFVLLGSTANAEAAEIVNIAGYSVPKLYIIIALSIFFFILGLVIARILKKMNKTANKISE